jgi:hypothetical protein
MRLSAAVLILSLCVPGAALAAQQAVTAELIRLHDALHLTAAQEAAWTRYTQAIAPNSQAEARHQAADSLMSTLTTPRRIALISATMAADEADFRRYASAVTAFYGTLTPSQQLTFDRETLPQGGGQR